MDIKKMVDNWRSRRQVIIDRALQGETPDPVPYSLTVIKGPPEPDDEIQAFIAKILTQRAIADGYGTPEQEDDFSDGEEWDDFESDSVYQLALVVPEDQVDPSLEEPADPVDEADPVPPEAKAAEG